MSAIKWAKWLSVIALILVVLETIAVIPNLFLLAGEYSLLILGSVGQQIAVIFLAIVAVILSFRKEGNTVVVKKK
jgi:hypothetical protein